MKQLPLRLHLRDDASFANFYVGENGQALAHIKGMLEQGEQFIYLTGPSGAGCSHLLQACCNEAESRKLSAMYLSLAQVDGLDPGILTNLEFYTLICLDDIEGINGHKDWQNAVFHLFNRIKQQKNHLLVSGHHLPKQLGLSLPDLSSRLSWGLTLKLQPLCDQDKIAALRLRSNLRGIELSEQVGHYLLARYTRDLPALLVMLEKLETITLETQRKLTIPLLKEVETELSKCISNKPTFGLIDG